MTDRKSSIIFGAALATAAVAGAAYVLTRRERLSVGGDPSVIPIFTPMIDLYTVDEVLARMEKIRGDEVTLVLHTPGGCVASCVMIADALAQFRRSTAIVPYLALSGGTLIALAADRIAMGRRAALSAVDPVVHGQRARHIEAGDDAGRHAMAQEYYHAVHRQLRSMLARHLGSGTNLERALSVFMGLDAPHEWPIYTLQLAALGLPVVTADAVWSDYVDSHRSAWR